MDREHWPFDSVYHFARCHYPVYSLGRGYFAGRSWCGVPLVVAAAPFVGRMVEQSLAEVDAGLVEAAQSFGASTWQIVAKVFLWESLPSLIRGFSIVLITLLGYSAMAGTVGAGGLGDIAIRYGYQRYMVDVMIATIVILIVLVQIVQSGCDLAARKIDRKK